MTQEARHCSQSGKSAPRADPDTTTQPDTDMCVTSAAARFALRRAGDAATLTVPAAQPRAEEAAEDAEAEAPAPAIEAEAEAMPAAAALARARSAAPPSELPRPGR